MAETTAFIAGVRFAGQIEPAAVVLDRQPQHRIAAIDDDTDGSGLGRVLGHVGESLLDDAIDRRAHLLGQLVDPGIAAMKVGRYAVAFAPVRNVGGERAGHAELVKRGGPQFPGDVVQRLAHLIELLAQPADAVAADVIGLRLDALELQHGGGQGLAGLIMELVRQPQPLLLLTVDDAAAQIVALHLGHLAIGPVVERAMDVERPPRRIAIDPPLRRDPALRMLGGPCNAEIEFVAIRFVARWRTFHLHDQANVVGMHPAQKYRS